MLRLLLGGMVLVTLTASVRADPIFAVVVGVNRPINRRSQRLHYADDDAILLHQVMAAAGYSRLLVEPDRESLLLHGDQPEARRPTRSNLRAALQQVFSSMSQARRRGLRPQLYFIYSGHGDVEHGHGFLALADGRLTSADLAQMLRHSPAVTNHVIIDACRSYYLVHSRRLPGPTRGGRHARPWSLARLFPNTGFVLSTASATNSHEWIEVQGGVFSHLVRSGLMGAADVNNDERVSYDELWAFVQSATARIPSRRFRPRIYVRPPRGDAGCPLLDWRRFRGATVTVEAGRYVLENDDGVRLADLHCARGTTVTLRLPQDPRPDGQLVLHDLRGLMEYPLDLRGASRRTRLEDLPGRPSSYRAKGPAHDAYAHLFEEAFGPDRLRQLLICRPGKRSRFPCRFGAVARSSGAPPPPGPRQPQPRPAPQEVAALTAGVGAMSQRLTFNDAMSQGVDSGWFGTLLLNFEFYPLAAQSTGVPGNLGIVWRYYHSLGLTATAAGEQTPATLQELCGGLRLRWRLFQRRTSPTLLTGVEGGFQQLELELLSQQGTRYLFLRLLLLGARFPLLIRGRSGLEAELSFDYRAALSTGPLEAHHGPGRGSGFLVSGGLNGWAGRLLLGLSAFYQRYGLEFDGCPSCSGATAAVDTYYGLSLRGGYRY